jgi:cell division septation protein DedD
LAVHPEDGFHEIQLNGKQLVFLFMAATVVSVVIFLCGVLVGRGVQAERAADAGLAAIEMSAEPLPEAFATETATPAGADPTTAAAPPAVDELSYFTRLEETSPVVEELKPAPPSPSPAAAPAASPSRETTPAAQRGGAAAAAATTPPAAAGPAPAATPSRSGYVVQIAALNVRNEAEAIAERLAAKGYSAYVESPASGSPPIYRVRIGRFDSRREAETVAAKLEKEEQFKPWVTR